MIIFAERLNKKRRAINPVEILGKFAGAVGNYNAHVSAYPEVNWPQVSEQFVTFLALGFNPCVTQVNEAALNKDLDNSWEVLAEPIQTVMRWYGVEEPYEKLKELTRGRAVTRDSITQFINCLEIPVKAKTQFLKLTPHNYIGVVVQLVEDADRRGID